MSVPFSIANNWAELPEVQRSVVWQTGSGTLGECFVADVDGRKWRVRVNDFPDEPAHTLIIADEEVLHFDDWPEFWVRPAYPKMQWPSE
jgi:hypothetical protein